MSEETPYPRFALSRLEAALADTPVVVLHGPRQCGKSTLARIAAERHGHTCLTLDDDNILRAAHEDPAGFCANLPPKVVIDEIQRAPELFTSIKALVDRDRRPGRFILTGSANVLLLPRLADSLAGRMEVLRLAPLAQIELARAAPGPGFLERLFAADFSVSSATTTRLGDDLIERVTTGGFPPALARATPRRRRDWHLAYADSLVQRDIRDLANIRSLEAVPRLLELAATQTSHLFNANALCAPLELTRPTVREYLSLLEKLFLIELLPPWHHNRLNRLVKTPKLHLADTGLAAALLGLDLAALKADRTTFGPLLESFVCQELRRMATWTDASFRFFHYRDKDQVEVDVIVERDGRDLCGVEVKASSTVTSADFAGLRRMQEICGPRFKCGVVFYDGETALPFGKNLFAVPYPALWATGNAHS
ncbi:MAG: ATP-binding protein [Opitutaceae bacterium]